jgi:hypothetical protein
VLREFRARGNDALALEPENGWCRGNLPASHGVAALTRFHQCFPELAVTAYGVEFDHEAVLDQFLASALIPPPPNYATNWSQHHVEVSAGGQALNFAAPHPAG